MCERLSILAVIHQSKLYQHMSLVISVFYTLYLFVNLTDAIKFYMLQLQKSNCCYAINKT